MFREVNRNLEIDPAEVGLTVRNDKSQAYVHSSFQPQDAAHCRDGIPPGGYFETDESGDFEYSRPLMVEGEPTVL